MQKENKPVQIVSLYGWSGYSALYINGKLITDNFTAGQNRIIEALGHTVLEIESDSTWYNREVYGKDWPENLSECIIKK